jgi:hypothetical protein
MGVPIEGVPAWRHGAKPFVKGDPRAGRPPLSPSQRRAIRTAKKAAPLCVDWAITQVKEDTRNAPFAVRYLGEVSGLLGPGASRGDSGSLEGEQLQMVLDGFRLGAELGRQRLGVPTTEVVLPAQSTEAAPTSAPKADSEHSSVDPSPK